MATFKTIKDVEISPSGKFKYILIKVTDKATDQVKFIVRGDSSCPYHADILDNVKQGASKEVKLNCPGGGRIIHDPEAKKILVFGYSVGYGRGDHQMAVDILKKEYEDYDITFSNEGY
uniref:Sex-regulated protein janus-A n=1 Tax=Rhabditophanes sp. KR3021 TaxID=114890 RepID=A0AC35TU76_9BILA